MGKYDCSGPFVLILGLGENVFGPRKAFNAQKLCSFKIKSCILLKKKLQTTSICPSRRFSKKCLLQGQYARSGPLAVHDLLRNRHF